MASNGGTARNVRERSDFIRRYVAQGPREGKQQAIAALHELTTLALQVRSLDKALSAERKVAEKLEDERSEILTFLVDVIEDEWGPIKGDWTGDFEPVGRWLRDL